MPPYFTNLPNLFVNELVVQLGHGGSVLLAAGEYRPEDGQPLPRDLPAWADPAENIMPHGGRRAKLGVVAFRVNIDVAGIVPYSPPPTPAQVSFCREEVENDVDGTTGKEAGALPNAAHVWSRWRLPAASSGRLAHLRLLRAEPTPPDHTTARTSSGRRRLWPPDPLATSMPVGRERAPGRRPMEEWDGGWQEKEENDEDEEDSMDEEDRMALMTVLGDWRIESCEVRCSIITALVVGGRGRMVIANSSLGGIGGARGTHYAQRHGARCRRQAEAAKANAEAHHLSVLAEEAKIKTAWDENFQENLKTIENPEDAYNDVTALCDQAIEAARKSERLAEPEDGDDLPADILDPRDITSFQAAMETAAASVAAKRQGEAWNILAERCGDVIALCGEARCDIFNCSLSMASMAFGCGMRLVQDSSLRGRRLFVQDVGIGLFLQGRAAARLELSALEGLFAAMQVMSNPGDTNTASLELVDCLLAGPEPSPLWWGLERPEGGYQEIRCTTEQKPKLIPDQNMEATLDQLDAAHKEALEKRLASLDLSSTYHQQDERGPGWNILFANEKYSAPFC